MVAAASFTLALVVGFLNLTLHASCHLKKILSCLPKDSNWKHGFQNDPQDFFTTKPPNQAWQLRQPIWKKHPAPIIISSFDDRKNWPNSFTNKRVFDSSWPSTSPGHSWNKKTWKNPANLSLNASCWATHPAGFYHKCLDLCKNIEIRISEDEDWLFDLRRQKD